MWVGIARMGGDDVVGGGREEAVCWWGEGGVCAVKRADWIGAALCCLPRCGKDVGGIAGHVMLNWGGQRGGD